MSDETLDSYRKRVKEHLDALLPVFAKACIGEYPITLDLPEQDDEFQPIYTGVRLMLDIIHKQVSELQDLNQTLEKSVQEKTSEIERQLNLSKALLEAQSDLGNGLALVDGQSQQLITINSALCEMTGYSAVELADYPSLLSLVEPDELPRVRQQLDQLAKSGSLNRAETSLLHKNGTKVYVEAAVKRLEVEGSFKYIVIIRNITERKRAEEQRLSLLQEQVMRQQAEVSKDRAVFLFEASALLFSSLENQSVPDILAKFAVINMADWCCVALGGDQGEIQELVVTAADPAKQFLMKDLDQFRPKPDWSNHPLIRVLKTGKSLLVSDVDSQTVESFTNNAPTQNILHKMGLSSTMCLPIQVRGKVLGALWMNFSESARRYDQDDLEMGEELALRAGLAINNMELYRQTKETEERFRQMADTAPVFIWMSGTDMKYSFFNKAWIDFTGRKMEQELGDGWTEYIHPEDLEHSLWFYTKAFKERTPFKMEYRFMRADGQYRWILNSGVPRFAPDGSFTGYIGSCMDINDRKTYEYQLAKARDVALESARLKSEFVANVSHEIRTPMNAIVGMTGLIMTTHLSGKQKEFIETIRTSCESLLSVINDLLDFSKMEAGKMELELHPFKLREMVEGIMALLATRAHAKGLELVVFMDPDLPEIIVADSGRIRQVLMNLITNAVKFTRHGEVVVRITKDSESESHVSLHFSVTDTGLGIHDHQRSKIFQPFSQADNSVTRQYGGTGIGLAISKRFVDLMKGEINFESTPHQGSIFWFRLLVQKYPEKPKKTRPSPSKTLRVLVVDDHTSNRKSVIQLLDTLKFCAAEGASNGTEALALLKQGSGRKAPFDWVILNRKIAGEEGMAVARKIIATPLQAPCRLLMMGPVSQPVDLDKLNSLGIEGYLSKPIRLAALFSKLVTPLQMKSKNLTKRPVSRSPKKKLLQLLVAEDNPVNQRVVTLQLQELGYTADVVGNGLEALRALKKVPYDLVLMDCQMPEMDGYKAAQEIRKSEKNDRHVPIIAMTAHAMPGDRDKCLAAGMDDYLSKPISTEALADILTKWSPRGKTAKNDAPEAPSPKLVFGVIKPPRGLTNRETLRRLARLFLRKTPSHISTMRKALQKKDSEMLMVAAHTLKGGSSSLGIDALSNLSLQIQDLAEKKKLKEAAPVFEKLTEEFDRIQRVLTMHLRRKKHEDTSRR